MTSETTSRGAETRNQILTVAERLFAEHGVFAVSNRRISEEAGQGNNAAVGYHFGTKADLVRAIVRRHQLPIEEARRRMLAELGDSAEARDWITCLVRPSVEYLGTLDSPTWYSRFVAQVMTDPVMRETVLDEGFSSSVRRATDGLNRCLPSLPPAVRLERGEMARHLIVHVLAERERALASGDPTPRPDWESAAHGLIDAITGLWFAPVTEPTA
ncbi:TetR family transcriptional regulator [Streptomyces sp. NPDC005438]|uniref:TetR/AcrR family transcriptional regulator n=1 Tax=Streptomyces sp. NPDC005438 TaxID=3156880 RepID=UPI0033A2AA7B